MSEKVAPPKIAEPKHIPNGLKFVFGGVAGMAATCVVQPLDLIKTRMQLSGGRESSFTVASKIIKAEGPLAVYRGLTAGLLRQATYTTTRLGVYNYLFDLYKDTYDGATPDFGTKMAIGLTAGSIAAVVGTPAEVALIRMTADGRLPADQRRNYKNVIDALLRIIREEGTLKLWRGTGPTVARAMVVNAVQLGTYSQAREIMLLHMSDGILLHFCSSMMSGFFTTVASMPVDIIKTKIQNAKGGKGGAAVIRELLAKEGILSLWKGFLPYYARLGPHTTLTFMVLEQLNSFYLRNVA